MFLDFGPLYVGVVVLNITFPFSSSLYDYTIVIHFTNIYMRKCVQVFMKLLQQVYIARKYEIFCSQYNSIFYLNFGAFFSFILTSYFNFLAFSTPVYQTSNFCQVSLHFFRSSRTFLFSRFFPLHRSDYSVSVYVLFRSHKVFLTYSFT